LTLLPLPGRLGCLLKELGLEFAVEADAVSIVLSNREQIQRNFGKGKNGGGCYYNENSGRKLKTGECTMCKVFASWNIQVGFSSAIVTASLRRSDRGTKVVIVHILDTFLDVGRDRIDDVLRLLITVLPRMRESSPNVSLEVHLDAARGAALVRGHARAQRRIELSI
jgi:hypothetical protein